jgi:hypothetical protein
MACALTQGYTKKVCKDPSGVAEYIIGEWSNVAWDDNAKFALTSNVVTTLTMATGKRAWTYKQVPEIANWKQTGASDQKTGGYGYKLEVNLQTQGIETATQEENDLILKNTLFVIAKHNDGTYWLLGHEFGLDASNVDTDSGTEMTSFKGDIIKLVGSATVKAKKVNSALIAALSTPA